MAWTWTNTAAAGAKIKAALITEIQNAIKQLAADIYTAPENDGDGSANLANPIQKSWKAGASTTNGSTGREITFNTAEADTNYAVSITFLEDPGPNVGHVWVAKATNKITVYNVGDTGKSFAWSIIRHQNA